MTLKISKIARTTLSLSPLSVVSLPQSSCTGKDLSYGTTSNHVVAYDSVNSTYVIAPDDYASVFYPLTYPIALAPDRVIVTTTLYTGSAYLCGVEYKTTGRQLISMILNAGGYSDDTATATFALPAADYGYDLDSIQFFMYNARYNALIIADGNGSNYKWHIYTWDRQNGTGTVNQRYKSAAYTGAIPSIPVGYSVTTNAYVLLQKSGNSIDLFTIDFTGTGALTATWSLSTTSTTLANTSLYKYGNYWYTSLTVGATRTYCRITATTVESIYAGHLDTLPFDDLVRYGEGLGRDLDNDRIVLLTSLYPGVHAIEEVHADDVTGDTVYFFDNKLAIKKGAAAISIYTHSLGAVNLRVCEISTDLCLLGFLDAFSTFYGKNILLYEDTTLIARLMFLRKEYDNGFLTLRCLNHENEISKLIVPTTYSASSCTTILGGQLRDALYTYQKQIDAGISIDFDIRQGYNLKRVSEDMQTIQSGVYYVNADGGYCFRTASYESTGKTLSQAAGNYMPNLQGTLASNFGRIRVYGAFTGATRLVSEVVNTRADINQTLEFEYPTITDQTELDTLASAIISNEITGYTDFDVTVYFSNRLIKGHTILVNLTGYTTQFKISISVDQLYYIKSCFYDAITRQARIHLISGTGFRDLENVVDQRVQQQLEIVGDRVATLETDAGECIALEFTGVVGSITKDPEGYAYYARNTTANQSIFDGFVKRGGTFKLYFLLSVGSDYATASQYRVNVGAITNGVSYVSRTNNLQNNVNFDPVMNANGTIGQHTEGTNLTISDGSRIGVILNHDVSDGVAGTGYVWGAYLVRQ